MPSASQPTSSASTMQGGSAEQGLANDGEASREVFAAAAQDDGAIRTAVELRPPAVVLDLVQPLRPRGRGSLSTGAEGR